MAEVPDTECRPHDSPGHRFAATEQFCGRYIEGYKVSEGSAEGYASMYPSESLYPYKTHRSPTRLHQKRGWLGVKGLWPQITYLLGISQSFQSVFGQPFAQVLSSS